MSEDTDGLYDFELESTLTGEDAAQQFRRVAFLYSTPVGTVATDREFGINMDFLGRPAETAQALYVAEIVDKTAKFVPAVRVKSVTWNADASGKAKPKVVIEDA